jgi:Mn-dependent DtxR family transcriptional regulator
MYKSESAEMYLETILLLGQERADVRSIDIVRKTGYSKPSVSRAVGLLKKSEDITVDESGFITLTDKGRARAQKVLERHQILTAFFCSIGVDADTADDDACRIEHVISDASFEKIKAFLQQS